MRRKSKRSKKLRLSIVKRYLDGEESTVSLAKEINTNKWCSGQLDKKYQTFGESAFDTSATNTSYTKNFKEQILLDYLNGGGSYNDLATKYHVSLHK